MSLPQAPHPPAARAEHDESVVSQGPRQNELEQDRDNQEDEEPSHYALAFTSSMRSARKLTPWLVPTSQVVAMRFVTLMGVNSLSPLGSPATFTVIESLAPPPAAKIGTLNSGVPFSSSYGAFVS